MTQIVDAISHLMPFVTNDYITYPRRTAIYNQQKDRYDWACIKRKRIIERYVLAEQNIDNLIPKLIKASAMRMIYWDGKIWVDSVALHGPRRWMYNMRILMTVIRSVDQLPY